MEVDRVREAHGKDEGKVFGLGGKVLEGLKARELIVILGLRYICICTSIIVIYI